MSKTLREQIMTIFNQWLNAYPFRERQPDKEVRKVLLNLEKEALGLLDGYEQKLQELADLLKNRPYKMPHKRGEYGQAVESCFEEINRKVVALMEQREK